MSNASLFVDYLLATTEFDYFLTLMIDFNAMQRWDGGGVLYDAAQAAAST
jgi:hypothetical protein